VQLRPGTPGSARSACTTSAPRTTYKRQFWASTPGSLKDESRVDAAWTGWADLIRNQKLKTPQLLGAPQ
jgi:hypothetical protein